MVRVFGRPYKQTALLGDFDAPSSHLHLSKGSIILDPHDDSVRWISPERTIDPTPHSLRQVDGIRCHQVLLLLLVMPLQTLRREMGVRVKESDGAHPNGVSRLSDDREKQKDRGVEPDAD